MTAKYEAFYESLPYVTKRKRPTEHCDGVKWSTVALKDLYIIGGHPARGIQEKSRCKRRGKWTFKALKLRGGARGFEAQSGTYCWSHLIQQFTANPQEEDRVNKYWKRWISTVEVTTGEDKTS